MTATNDEVIELLDKFMGEFRDMGDEFTLQMDKYEKIGELEERIEILEKKIDKMNIQPVV